MDPVTKQQTAREHHKKFEDLRKIVLETANGCTPNGGRSTKVSSLEEKEEKVESVREAFTNFKTEIAKAAENSRSGKPIPRKIIRQFEETELRKDEDVSKVRLRNINLKTQLRKLEGKLREEARALVDWKARLAPSERWSSIWSTLMSDPQRR